MTPQQEFGSQQPLNSYGPPGMYPSSGYANLSSQAIAEAVTESRGCIDIDACAINLS